MTRIDERALTVACTRCGAGVGEKCLSMTRTRHFLYRSRHTVMNAHAERKDTLRRLEALAQGLKEIERKQA